MGTSFAWGFISHREKVFPFPQLRRAAVSLNVIKEPPEVIERRRLKKVDYRSPASKTIKALEALGYVEEVYDPDHEKSGVLLHDPNLTYDAPRFFDVGNPIEAHLIDVEGTILHRWHYPMGKNWHSVTLLDDGDILVVRRNDGLYRLTSDSRLVWKTEAPVHHDLDVFEDTIYALTRESSRRPDIHDDQLILADTVSLFTMDGKYIDKISIQQALEDSPYRFLLQAINDIEFAGPDDDLSGPSVCLLHANRVEVVDGSLAHLGPVYTRGNLLIGLRNVNISMILNPTTRKIEWIWGPNNLTWPHHPVLLDTGRILLFDNGEKQSEVVEIDPLTYRVHWRYTDEDFFSGMRGAVQRLPNGNTLITEGGTGYIFEVTPDKQMVWEYANPNVSSNGKRRRVWRMTAYPPGTNTFVDSLTAN
jgi:outer membrane protein assembly factor BamB